MPELRTPATLAEMDDARALMRALTTWHRARNRDDMALIDSYFDPRAFEAELAALPGAFAPPRGRLYVAYDDDGAIGCAALKDLGEGDCEMKRMFVPEAARGKGIGRMLASRIIADAQEIGYRRMLLDTSWRQREAIGLYESLGFRRIAPYYDVSAAMRDWLVFFELELQPTAR